ncbi:MAG TPA: hypothetical protein VHH36_01990 [Candidatus Thermoplasmatota archaeon]|nr:hypothetical protein [Candidatus Thermoplasmatota archaeon]
MPRRTTPKATDDDRFTPRVNLDLARAEPMTLDDAVPRRPA